MRLCSLVLACVTVVLGAAGSAWAVTNQPGEQTAGPAFTLVLRENLTGVSNGNPITGIMRPPVGPGVAGIALVPTFALPAGVRVRSGDVVMTENPDWSDVLRFMPLAGDSAALSDSVQFFSGLPDEPSPPASDVGLPTALLPAPPSAPAFFRPEAPDANGCTPYTPGGGTYSFCSDDPYHVPSLTSWGMIGLTLLLLGTGTVFVLRRRQAIA